MERPRSQGESDLGCHVEDLSGLRLDELLKGLGGKFSASGKLIELDDVGIVVLPVVKLDGLLGDVGHKGVMSVGKRREGESHLIETQTSDERPTEAKWVVASLRGGKRLLVVLYRPQQRKLSVRARISIYSQG